MVSVKQYALSRIPTGGNNNDRAPLVQASSPIRSIRVFVERMPHRPTVGNQLVSSKRFSDVRSSFKFPEPPISNGIPAAKPSAYGAIDPRPTKGVEQGARGKPHRSCYAAMRVRQHGPDGEDGGSAGCIQTARSHPGRQLWIEGWIVYGWQRLSSAPETLVSSLRSAQHDRRSYPPCE
uniref:Uncharacterized protein n=1 Tax=Mycena chlorophos TaxID=658473 RepID=A0ABQ0LXA9_MYCCL|nr:predicted protein [Mycena chlorophos]